MTTVVVPAAGQSSRYGLARPKFLLQHPLGGTMVEAALSALGDFPSLGIDRVQIITLEEFFQGGAISPLALAARLESRLGVPVHLELLEGRTSSMVETICLGLNVMESDTPFIVRDVDNLVVVGSKEFFDAPNGVVFADLSRFTAVPAHNKSFLTFGSDMTLVSIVEKRIVSPLINVGCVKFNSASDFLTAAKLAQSDTEVYVSDVIRVMLDWNRCFVGYEAEAYEDWGTLDEWRAYCSSFKTFFVDIDGVVAYNENPLAAHGGWARIRPIQANVDALLELEASGRTHIVFVTSREEEFRTDVQSQLRDLGFNVKHLVMGLPHASRTIINDFAPTNPYPTALAINHERDSDKLRDFLW